MEPLPTTILSEEFLPLPARKFFLCSCDSWKELAESVKPSSQYFSLLVIADSSQIADDLISNTAKVVLARGLASFCAWGPDCERVHDIFDTADVTYESDAGRGPTWSPEDVVMTTWHSEERLSEAVWYFVNCATPTTYFEQTCTDWILVVIGNKGWEHAVRDEIARIEREAQEYRKSRK